LGLGELRTIVAKIEADVLHIPEELKEMLGPDTRIIAGTTAAIMFSAGTSYADILTSLEMIKEDIQYRASKEKSKQGSRKSKPQSTKNH
jgi:hypothetical protein